MPERSNGIGLGPIGLVPTGVQILLSAAFSKKAAVKTIMQTFLPFEDIKKTAEVLDDKRLGKQRIEAIQIARILLNITNTKGWRTHPAVKMWKGYEAYLIKVYLRTIMDEWANRGFKNIASEKHYEELSSLVKNQKPIPPNWITEEFTKSHQSNLLRKFSEHYSKFFLNVPSNLEYIWPIN